MLLLLELKSEYNVAPPKSWYFVNVGMGKLSRKLKDVFGWCYTGELSSFGGERHDGCLLAGSYRTKREIVIHVPLIYFKVTRVLRCYSYYSIIWSIDVLLHVRHTSMTSIICTRHCGFYALRTYFKYARTHQNFWMHSFFHSAPQ